MNYVLSAFYLLFTTLGVVFTKLGGDSLKISIASSGLVFKIGAFTFFGFIFYLCSFILWQKLLAIVFWQNSKPRNYIIPFHTLPMISNVILLAFLRKGFS